MVSGGPWGQFFLWVDFGLLPYDVSASPSEKKGRLGLSKGQGCRITSGGQRTLGKERRLLREARGGGETHELPQCFAPKDQLTAAQLAFHFYLKE